LLGDNYFVSSLDSLASTIIDIIKNRNNGVTFETTASSGITVNENDEVTW